MEAVKRVAARFDAWILIEDTIGKERSGLASRVDALVAPETALHPTGGPVAKVLRWALCFLTLLGFAQGMLAAYWSLETRSLLSVGWLGHVAIALLTLALMRSQPIYSALFASWVGVGMLHYPYRWLDLGPVGMTWLLGVDATVTIWVLLAVALVVEWSEELGRVRGLIYRGNLVAACFLLPPFWPLLQALPEGIGIFATFLALPLILHTERCFFLGVRRTIRGFSLVVAGGVYATSRLLWQNGLVDLDSLGGELLYLVSIRMILLGPLGCIVWEWARRRRGRAA